MPINYSGQLSMGNTVVGQSIAIEQGLAPATANLSLRALSSTAGKSTPDAMSEFYGYVKKSVTFSSTYQISGTSGTTGFSGTVTIVGTAATFKAYASVSSGGPCSVNINVGGNARSAYKSGTGTTESTTFTLNPGVYSYSGSVSITGGYCQGGIQFPTQA